MFRKLVNCWNDCFSGGRSEEKKEEERRIIKHDTLPYTVSIQTVTPNHPNNISCNLMSRNVEFTIPRKMTPSAMDSATTGSEEESHTVSPVRSRSSTFDNPCKIELDELNLELYTHYDSDDSYVAPTDHMGRIWYSLGYDEGLEQLIVTLIKAKSLPQDSNTKECLDCYFRISLLPDEKRFIQSKKRKQQSDPNFDEEYKFQLPLQQVKKRSVKFTLYQCGLDKRYTVTGHAIITLDNSSVMEALLQSPSQKYWIDLSSSYESDHGKNAGKILISLHYERARQRLFVNVFKCVQLALSEPTDMSLRIELMTQSKRIKKVRGLPVKEVQNEPEFNESFKFSIAESKLAVSSVSVCIKGYKHGNNNHHHHQEKTTEYGRVVLGGYLLAIGKELNHWQTMIERPDEQHTQWHSLSTYS